MSRLRLIADLLSRPRTYRYGRARSQRCDLHLPRGPGPHPVVVLVHGGYWQQRYGKLLMRGLAADLARRGWAAWNIEYRRLGRGQDGGWPATFADVAAAIDLLDELAQPLDLDLERVVAVGHSAGGQLAVWAGGRGGLPAGAPGAAPRVSLSAVAAQAGVLDLAASYRSAPHGAVGQLMGGGPEEVPEHYAIGDPIAAVPLPIPVLLVHGRDDATVSVRRSREYFAAARAAGGQVTLIELEGPDGRHRAHIDPSGAAWAAVVSWLEGLGSGAGSGLVEGEGPGSQDEEGLPSRSGPART